MLYSLCYQNKNPAHVDFFTVITAKNLLLKHERMKLFSEAFLILTPKKEGVYGREIS